MRPRDQEKYNAIINASIRQINELVFAGISISKIAKEAKVSPATIYIYFKNKEDLFIKIYIDIRQKMSEAALQGLNDDTSIEDSFKKMWYNYFNYNLEHYDYLIYREHFEKTSMMTKVQQEEFGLYKWVSNLFQRGIKEKIIKDIPLPLLASFALFPIITLLKANFDGTFKMDDQLIKQSCEIAWTIVKKED
ncbi:MAG: TetR/AcrR family transcriptional regulator [Candidatus Hermodarchaeota archaeon]